MKLILRFIHYADRIGFRIPDDSLENRKQLKSFARLVNDYHTHPSGSLSFLNDIKQYPQWPWNNVLNVMSLMQHSGMPTRYLDWTTIPLNALYFAAKQAFNNKLNNGYIAIYIISEGNFTQWYDVFDENLFLLKPIPAGNNNLINQKGLFTFHKQSFGSEELIGSHNKYIKVRENRNEGMWSSSNSYLFLLPHSEVKDLLMCLDAMGVNNSTLFPSWEGITNTIIEEGFNYNFDNEFL